MRSWSFVKEDLVLRLKQKKTHKLPPPWEGPYIIAVDIGNGAYSLKDFATGVT